MDPVVDARLLLHQVHRKARGLAQLGSGERRTCRGLVGHPQCREGTRVGGIALGALQPPLGKMLGAHRIHHRDRHLRALQCRGQGHPIVAAGLHDHPLDRCLASEPPRELEEPRAVCAKAQHRLLRNALTIPTDSRDVLALADVDAHAGHLRPPRRNRSREARPLRPTSADHRSPASLEAAAGSRSPSMNEARGPDTRPSGSTA